MFSDQISGGNSPRGQTASGEAPPAPLWKKASKHHLNFENPFTGYGDMSAGRRDPYGVCERHQTGEHNFVLY